MPGDGELRTLRDALGLSGQSQFASYEQCMASASGRQDNGPGKFDGRRGIVARCGDDNAEIGRQRNAVLASFI